jgi:hypothetical protein
MRRDMMCEVSLHEGSSPRQHSGLLWGKSRSTAQKCLGSPGPYQRVPRGLPELLWIERSGPPSYPKRVGERFHVDGLTIEELKSIRNHDFRWGNAPLQVVDQVKYVGLRLAPLG